MVFFGYIGVENGQANLRLKIQYYASDWLFINSYIILADDQKFEIQELYTGEINRDNGGGDIWETLDRTAGPAEIRMMQAVANAKSAKIRFTGRRYSDDRTIKQSEKDALKNILLAYEALGGKL